MEDVREGATNGEHAPQTKPRYGETGQRVLELWLQGYTTKQTAELLNVHPSTIYRLKGKPELKLEYIERMNTDSLDVLGVLKRIALDEESPTRERINASNSYLNQINFRKLVEPSQDVKKKDNRIVIEVVEPNIKKQ
ncbi:MAG: helix-turn-helix domain-containing protein [Bacillaceae bacterium]|nr:helix-turn-helix domain-containing protein [Bacillaceae bacterium]